MFQELRTFDASRSGYQSIEDSGMERRLASEWFEKSFRQGKGKQFPASLLGRSRKLCDLAQVAQKAIRQHYLGLQTVALNKIRGSENRTHEFDIEFYPVEDHIEQRWISVAMAYLEGCALPPVELIQFGDIYYVRDGHHRISVAHALGQREIEAVITVWEAA